MALIGNIATHDRDEFEPEQRLRTLPLPDHSAEWLIWPQHPRTATTRDGQRLVIQHPFAPHIDGPLESDPDHEAEVPPDLRFPARSDQPDVH